jgi:hypothetical protein
MTRCFDVDRATISIDGGPVKGKIISEQLTETAEELMMISLKIESPTNL